MKINVMNGNSLARGHAGTSARAARARGQAFLAVVFLIGGIVVFAGVLLAFLASTFVDSGYGYQASIVAEAAANSGAQDALLQLDRNPAFSSAGYALAVGSTTATVSVTQNTPSAGYVTILSAATVSSRARKIQVVITEDPSTDAITVISFQETQ